LRYKVEIKGKDVLMTSNPKLFLPNHEALVDPQIVLTYLYKYGMIVPLITEIYFKNPLLKRVFKGLKAVPVSELSANNRDANVLNTIQSTAITTLKNNTHVLLYPSGQLTNQGNEKLYNKQSAWRVACQLPDHSKVIGLRISGLWGSIWSKALTGKSPDF